MSNNNSTVKDMLDKIFKISSFSTAPKFKHQEYTKFWTDLMTVSEDSYLCVKRLFERIFALENQKKLSNQNLSLETCLCTFFVVSTYTDINQKNNKHELIQLREQQKDIIQKQNATLQCPYTMPMIDNLHHFLVDNDETNFISNLIGQICLFPNLTKQNLDNLNQEAAMAEHLKQYYNQLEQYTKQAKSENQPYYSALLLQESELQETCELSFAYEHFQHFLRQKKIRIVPRVVFDSIVRYFKVLPQISKEWPEQAEKSILCLLHLTKQTFTFYGAKEFESIRSVLAQVQIFRRWPYPVGNLAQELVTLLFAECKSKGNAFRYKIREDIPEVDIQEEYQDEQMQQELYNQVEENKNDSNSYNNFKDQQKNKSKALYKAFIITDKEHTEANYLCQHYNKLFVNENKIQNTHILRTALVINMLNITKIQSNDNQKRQIDPKDDPDIISSICRKNPRDIFKIYCRLLNVIDKCDELDALIESRIIQEEVFEQITKEIRELPDDTSYQAQSIYDVIKENMVTFIPEYPYCQFELITKNNTNNAQLTKQSTLKQGGQQIKTTKAYTTQQTQKDDIDQVYQTLYFPLTDEFDQKRKKDILNKFKQKFFNNDRINQIPSYQEPHRFIIIGGDAELHGFVQFLGEIFCEDKEKKIDTKKLDLRIYIVPSKKNTLAHFLASKDVWYQRYLYIPFNEQILITKQEYIEVGKNGQIEYPLFDCKKNIILPYKLRLEALHSYIREANRAFNVRVYKINCVWNDQSIEQKCIYFCQYVEIGESVEAERFQQKEKKKENLTHYDLKEKNQIKYSGQNLKVTFQSIDYLGNLWKEETFEDNINSIKINNIYKEYFEGNTPFPNSHWLEFTCITQENAKLFDANLKQKHIFKKHGREQIQAAFKALFTSIPIETITIKEKNDNPFSIFVDGKIINNLKQISIEPVKDSKNPDLVLSIPIMTFLPLKL